MHIVWKRWGSGASYQSGHPAAGLFIPARGDRHLTRRAGHRALEFGAGSSRRDLNWHYTVVLRPWTNGDPRVQADE